MIDSSIMHYHESIYLSSVFDPWIFREQRDRDQSSEETPDENLDVYSGQGSGRLLCAACRYLITNQGCRFRVQGGCEHSFVNPHGLLFHICCYRLAAGCRAEGNVSEEFTWFPGYAWRIANCGRCSFHLGWEFSGSVGSGFFGLIVDRLVEDEEPKAEIM